MNKKLLQNYFQGTSSQEEVQEVVRWFEQSDRHRFLFLSERKRWNASLLPCREGKKKGMVVKRVMMRVAAVAAVCLAVFGLWGVMDNGASREQTIFVPVGQRANLILADGTSVWLNSNTTFSYPMEFGKQKREVSIDGEAYFEVAHDKQHPFIVHAGKYQVEVLGTTFNLRAYGRHDGFETALVEGSVKVCDVEQDTEVVLSPHELVREAQGKLCKQTWSGEDAYNWKAGILAFRDEPIENVIGQLCAYYDAHIVWACNDGTGYRCTGKFSYSDGLDYILHILQKDLHFEIQKTCGTDTIVLR